MMKTLAAIIWALLLGGLSLSAQSSATQNSTPGGNAPPASGKTETVRFHLNVEVFTRNMQLEVPAQKDEPLERQFQRLLVRNKIALKNPPALYFKKDKGQLLVRTVGDDMRDIADLIGRLNDPRYKDYR